MIKIKNNNMNKNKKFGYQQHITPTIANTMTSMLTIAILVLHPHSLYTLHPHLFYNHTCIASLSMALIGWAPLTPVPSTLRRLQALRREQKLAAQGLCTKKVVKLKKKNGKILWLRVVGPAEASPLTLLD